MCSQALSMNQRQNMARKSKSTLLHANFGTDRRRDWTKEPAVETLVKYHGLFRIAGATFYNNQGSEIWLTSA